MTAFEYYGGFFSYSAIQARPVDLCPIDPETGEEIFIFEAGAIKAVIDHFFMSQVRALQDQINSKLDEASNLEVQAESISLAVSLNTVGVILSTSMVTR